MPYTKAVCYILWFLNLENSFHAFQLIYCVWHLGFNNSISSNTTSSNSSNNNSSSSNSLVVAMGFKKYKA